MLSVLLLSQDLKYILPAGFLLGVVPPVVASWALVRVATFILEPFGKLVSACPRQLHRNIDDWIYSLYSRLTIFFFETLSRTEVVFYGDNHSLEFFEGRQSFNGNTLVLSNHQTTADWMVMNILAARVNGGEPLGRIRYMMKSGLKFLPLIGFYLGPLARGGVFVRRSKNGKEHEINMHNYGRSLTQIQNWAKLDSIPTWLVIFPEGTRFDPTQDQKLLKSKEFAIQQRLQPLQHVLTPRVKAVHHSIQALHSSLTSLVQMTIAYARTMEVDMHNVKRLPAPSMSDILLGNIPYIHIHLKRIFPDEIAPHLQDVKSCQKWLHSLALDSDDRLKGFYSVHPGRRGKLLKNHDEIVKISRLSLLETLPSFVLFSFACMAIFATKSGRKFYWQSWLLGAPLLVLLSALSY